MQIHAFDTQKAVITVDKAKKGEPYFCLECGSIVHRRGGESRRDHFFHLEPTLTCRQNGKGIIHLQLQMQLKASLPPEEVTLERRFSSIQRIADVAWSSQRIVFEIQVSPISYDEIRARQEAYLSIGWQPVWVLHDSQFNSRHRSAAENFLLLHPHYYTDMNEEGKGIIYDIDEGRKAGVNLTDPKTASLKERAQLRSFLVGKRLTHSPLYFRGDLIEDRLKMPFSQSSKPSFFYKLKESCKTAFLYLLENASG